MAEHNIITDGKGIEIALAVEKICRDFTKEEMEKAEKIFEEVAKTTI